MIAVATITTTYYMVLSAIVFGIGTAGVLTRRNALIMFMSVELMLNAVNVALVAIAKSLDDVTGQVLVFFVLVVAAAEVAVGLSIMVAIFRRRRSAVADELSSLRG
ncbi:MAG: NADH-quinone oxidoreductase subunit NuoK [Acidimicrobiia bacterium]